MPRPSSPCLDAALDYLRRGWSPLPLCDAQHEGANGEHQETCRSPGKRPLTPWEHLQTSRATVGMLKTWWDRWPLANVGIALGPISGLIGLDIDGAEGEELLSRLSGEKLPHTLEFTTGKGRRLLFAWPAEIDVKNQEYKLGAGELRILAKGRQTVAPPSKHPSGAEYSWVDGCRPGDVEPAQCPEWLLDVLKGNHDPHRERKSAHQFDDRSNNDRGTQQPDSHDRPHQGPQRPASSQHHQDRIRLYLAECQPAIAGQRGHDQTFKVACKLVKGFSLDPDTALRWLIEEYNPRCQPPWSEKELRHKVQDATKAEGEDGFLLNQPPPSPNAPFAASVAATPRPEPKTTAKFTPELIDATALLKKDFPELKWAVDGIVPEGATILAGSPKIGKSWLTLNLACAIATGGVALSKIPVEKAPVLYLALEDGQRRLQRRLNKLLAAQPGPLPELLTLTTAWARPVDGGLTALECWLTQHRDCRLVIIDTLARIRAKRRSDTAIYDEDYQAVADLQTIATTHAIAIVIIHHTRKASAEDPLDEVSGSLGLTGAADVGLVLKRKRKERTGKLFVTGRDVEEQTYHMMWDPSVCLWTLGEPEDGEEEQGPDAGLPPDQVRVRQALRDAPGPLDLQSFVALLRKDPKAVNMLLGRMVSAGHILRPERGLYTLPVTGVTPLPSSNNQSDLPL